MISQRVDTTIVLPGIASAHSHAFQRALRGRTQALSQQDESFWSWRSLMYRFASKLDPQSMYTLCRYAFAELALNGVTAVGEFHYLHHDPSGQPYSNRTEMAEMAIRAAQDIGIRIALLRVVYQRGGQHQSLDPVQKRFADADLDDVFEDIAALKKQFSGDESVQIGLAPHSVRAVPQSSLLDIASFLRAQGDAVPVHAHVSEQEAENKACYEEYACSPVEVFADAGLLGPHFCAVHATHLSSTDIKLLADSKSIVCLCRGTERDLGDGLPLVRELCEAKIPICFGADSHAISDPFEEARAAELDERSRLKRRQVALDGQALLRASSEHGYQALGMHSKYDEDRVVLSANDPALVSDEQTPLDDLVMFSATARAVRDVVVGKKKIVENGILAGFETIKAEYQKLLRKLVMQ
ncbi:MAG: formimidoylglutamate deiminase [Myxococcales bacterium]|nr:MAG: formimidoylglutamate deiminase [Myxococcales bacterium]